jgi:hypothetical protein
MTQESENVGYQDTQSKVLPIGLYVIRTLFLWWGERVPTLATLENKMLVKVRSKV